MQKTSCRNVERSKFGEKSEKKTKQNQMLQQQLGDMKKKVSRSQLPRALSQEATILKATIQDPSKAYGLAIPPLAECVIRAPANGLESLEEHHNEESRLA